MLTATFRGRPLNGKIERVPSGYTGLSYVEIKNKLNYRKIANVYRMWFS